LLLLLSSLGITAGQVRREDIQVLGMLKALCILKVSVSEDNTTTDSNITAGPSLPDCIGPAVINLHYRFKL
jgi:hypothetical protein